MADPIPVRVALRCRPMNSKENSEGCQFCLEFIPDMPQVVIGNNKDFTYDYTFSPDHTQEEIYNACIKPLLKNIFKGYNVTVLAYGQTGSGKTHTMGTVFSPINNSEESQMGVIPRAVSDLFSGMQEQPDTDFNTKVSFLEIYKEEVLDLLNPGNAKDDVVIREDSAGGVKIAGLQEISVTNLQDTMKCLEKGSLVRTTGATAMNALSSRSHAIFTISVHGKPDEEKCASFISKLHFVDLAGSERVKKTKAEGDRFKEGININLGLLALGNVISALCERSSRNHVPYRQSKLTRLLQDSLGGNSHTVMIACVSPADANMEETLNTLRYAHRARKIKNKPIINRDPATTEIARLKQLVQQLQMQLVNCQAEEPIKLENSDTASPVKGQYSRKVLLHRIEELEAENEKLSRELQLALEQTTDLCEKVIVADMKHDRLKMHLEELNQTTGITLEIFSQSADMENNSQIKENLDLIRGLKNKVSDIQADQNKSEVFMGNEDDKNLDTNNDENKIQDDTQFVGDRETTFRQAEMNRQLQTLNKVLAMKEELAGRLAINYGKIDHMKEHYEQNLKELEGEVYALQAEKEELVKALQEAKNNSASNKVSEQRRQRLKELEHQIAELKKKATEYDRLKRMKEQSDEQVKKLNQEILEMKQVRVRLVRQMRTEAEKQKQWKMEKEKEVCRLKKQERRCQVEFMRKQQTFDRQQNVLKRKMEEAMAVNKRLKEALLQQKLHPSKRNKENDPNGQNGVKKCIEQDLYLAVSSKEASHHLQSLLEDRKIIVAQLNKLKKMLKAKLGSSSSLSTSDSDDIIGLDGSPIPISHLQQRINDLEAAVELRNVQLADLQQEIIDADQEERHKVQWGAVQTMGDAKVGLKLLFEMCVAAKSDYNVTHCKLNELEKEYTDVNKTLVNLKNETETMKLMYEQKLTEMQKEHQDKVLFLLCQLPKTSGGEGTTPDELGRSSTECLNLLKETEIVTINVLKEQLENKTAECERLKWELEQAQHDKTVKLFTPTDGTSHITHPPSKKKKSGADSSKEEILHYDDLLLEESFEEIDNKLIDPDWHKTPLASRIRALKSKDKMLSAKIGQSLMDSSRAEFETLLPGNSNGRKRKSEERRCSCQSGCQTKRCRCVKEGARCNEQCGCKDCSNVLSQTE